MNLTMTIDTIPAVLAATLAGGGPSVLPDTLPSGRIHAVYRAARFRPAKVGSFVEMLVRRSWRRHPD
ncbi:hypothetical protein [Prosthecomicrobium sp. N25]|uniref:hypothetical protein n=1 Tax=Prosthecomicrobium sp. N25 TaxID=3129254 RepID=UPI003FCDD6D7